MSSFIHKHPGVTITLAGAYLSGLGLIYQFFLLRPLGFSSLHFSVPSDFLLALLRGLPFIAALMVIYIVLLFKDVLFYQRHAPGATFSERVIAVVRAMRKIEYVLLLLFLPVAAGFGGHVTGKNIGYSDERCKEMILDGGQASQVARGNIVESSAGYLFLVTKEGEALAFARRTIIAVTSCGATLVPQAAG